MSDYSHLSPEHRQLLRRFGFNAPNQASRDRRHAILLKKFAGDELKRRNIERAWRLAHVAPAKYGKAKAPKPKLDAKAADKILGAKPITKQEYNARMQRAKTDKNKAALRTAWKTRGKLERKRVQARRDAVAAMRKSARGGVKARSLHANMAMEERDRKNIANAITMLVGALQDFMAISHVSLAQTLHKAAHAFGSVAGEKVGGMIGEKVGTHYGLVGGLVGGKVGGTVGGKVGGKVTTTAMKVTSVGVALSPKILWGYLAKKVVTEGLGTNINMDAGRRWDRVAERAKKTVSGILRGQDVDVRPLVSAFVMSLDAGDISKIAKSMVHAILDKFVYNAYASSGPSFICTICKWRSMEACTSKSKDNKKPENVSKRLGNIVTRALAATNRLLSLDGTSVTKVLRAVTDTYIVSSGFLKWRATEWTLATAVGNPFIQYMAKGLHPKIEKILRAYGLGITKNDIAEILWNHRKAVGAFLYRTPGVAIEPTLIDAIVKAKPMSLVHGAKSVALGNSTNGASIRAFCTFCDTKCPLTGGV